ncbi:hypothetical protein GCM10027290_60600 [Micromonospora sonneratiae]
MPTGVDDPVDQSLGEEAHRIRLGLVAQPLLGTLYTDRHGTERSVVEMRDGRVEGEQESGTGNRFGRLRISGAHALILNGGYTDWQVPSRRMCSGAWVGLPVDRT